MRGRVASHLFSRYYTKAPVAAGAFVVYGDKGHQMAIDYY